MRYLAATLAVVAVTVPCMAGNGFLKIESTPDGAEVVVDGKPVGTTPQSIELPPGEHAVLVKHLYYENAEATVIVEADQVTRRRVDLEPLKGTLTIVSQPAAASVAIDGNRQNDTTPITVKNLTAGPHTITLTLGQKEVSRKAMVVPNQTIVFRAFMDSDEYERARRELEETLRKDYAASKWTESAKDASSLVELDPLNEAAIFRLAMSLRASKQRDDAKATYIRLICVSPRNAAAYNNLGAILAEEGDLDQALALYQLAAGIDKSDPLYVANQAQIYQRKGAAAEEVQALEQAVTLKSKDKRPWLRLMEIRSGDEARVKELFTTAMSLGVAVERAQTAAAAASAALVVEPEQDATSRLRTGQAYAIRAKAGSTALTAAARARMRLPENSLTWGTSWPRRKSNSSSIMLDRCQLTNSIVRTGNIASLEPRMTGNRKQDVRLATWPSTGNTPGSCTRTACR